MPVTYELGLKFTLHAIVEKGINTSHQLVKKLMSGVELNAFPPLNAGFVSYLPIMSPF